MLGLRRRLRQLCSLGQMTRKCRRNIQLFVAVLVITLTLFHTLPHYYAQEKQLTDVGGSRMKLHQERKLILVYTAFPHEPWVPKIDEADNYEFTDWDGTSCEESRCQITYDKNLLNISDAVLVHGIARNPTVKEMTANRPSRQRWVFYVRESPVTWKSVAAHFDGMFNWTATYRRDSDFFVPYGFYADSNTKTSERCINFARDKDKMVAFGVSNHCGGQRFAFARALMKHLPVDVYGKCAIALDPNTTWQCPHDLGQGCIEELKRHKFYLAFENSRCIDYITEKYWKNSLERGLLPVVLGGASYADPELVIPGSFINADDFDSVKELAEYLTYLDKNDTAYNQYFQWRRKYKVVKYEFWLCGLCKALHDSKIPAKTYHKLSEFWGVEETCKLGNQRIWDIINRG